MRCGAPATVPILFGADEEGTDLCPAHAAVVLRGRGGRICRDPNHSDPAYRLGYALLALEGIADRPDLEHEVYRKLVAGRVTAALEILRGRRCACTP